MKGESASFEGINWLLSIREGMKKTCIEMVSLRKTENTDFWRNEEAFTRTDFNSVVSMVITGTR